MWATSGGGINWNSGDWDVTLPLSAGDQVASVAVVVRDNGAANGHAADANNVIANLQSRVNGGQVNNLGFFTSTGSGLQQTLNIVLSSPHTLVDNEAVWLQMIPLAGGALPHVATIDSWVGTATVQSPAQPPAAPANLVTLTIPLVGPFVTGNSLAASLPMTSAASTVYVPFALPVGSTITKTRATISDNTAGPTTLRVGLVTVDGSGTGAATASSFGATSAGTGTVQSITSASMSAVVQSGHWYAVEVIYASGTGTASVKAAEVDYLP